MRKTKELTEAKLQELQFKKDWSINIILFAKKCTIESERAGWDSFIEAIVRAYERFDLRGMRMVYNDMNEMANGLGRSKIEELNAILREKFGEDLTTVNKRIAARIQKIEERGYINTEVEWRMVRDWIDHIMWDDSKDKEVELLEKLMSEYDKSIEKKRAVRKQKKRNTTDE